MRKLGALLLLLVGSIWADSIVPVNPADFMQDIVVNEGMRRTPTDNAGKERAFKEMLVEQVFLKDMFDTETSVFKPDEDNDDSLVLRGMSGIYGGYARKQLAEYIVQQGFLEDSKNNGK